jgi:hypothetical protein
MATLSLNLSCAGHRRFERNDAAEGRFRTIQVRPQDLPPPLWQAECAVEQSAGME